jgi:hypothetical protein
VGAYSEYVGLARSAPEFISRVEEALNGWTSKEADIRMKLASENSWRKRVNSIVQILEQLL